MPRSVPTFLPVAGEPTAVLAAFGTALDTAVLHRVARATPERLREEVAERLSQDPRPLVTAAPSRTTV